MLYLSKVEAIVNVMMYFTSLWCNLQINYLMQKFLFHFWNNGPNWYQNQNENPLQCKCFLEVIVSKYIKVNIFNENKHKVTQ